MHTRCKTLHFSCKQNYLFYYGKLLLYYIPNHNLVLFSTFYSKTFRFLWFLNWRNHHSREAKAMYDLWRMWFFSKSLLNWFALNDSFVNWIEWIAAVFESTNHWFIWSGQRESPVNISLNSQVWLKMSLSTCATDGEKSKLLMSKKAV